MLNPKQFGQYMDRTDKITAGIAAFGVTAALTLGGIGVHQELTQPDTDSSSDRTSIPRINPVRPGIP